MRSTERRVEQLLAAEGIAFEPPRAIDEEAAATILFDFADIDEEEYLQDGFVFGDRPRRAGEPFLTMEEGVPQIRFAARAAAVSDPIWNGLGIDS